MFGGIETIWEPGRTSRVADGKPKRTMNAADVLDSRYSWVRLALTLTVAAVGNVGMWAVVIIMPALQADFAIDRADASIPYTMTMLGFAIGNLVVGRIVDRFGVTAALLLATVLLGIGYSAAAVVGNIYVVYALHIIIGVGTGSCFGPLIADISHWFSRRRGIAVALVASGNYIAGAFWPTILGGLLATAGWRGVYSALAIIVVVAFDPARALAAPPRSGGDDGALRSVVRRPSPLGRPLARHLAHHARGGRRRLLHRDVDATGPRRLAGRRSRLRACGRRADPVADAGGRGHLTHRLRRRRRSAGRRADPAHRLDAAVLRPRAVPAVRRGGDGALRSQPRVRSVAGRHRAVLRGDRARVLSRRARRARSSASC